MDIYLIDETNNLTFHFPVNPINKLSIPKERRYRSAEILNFGDIDFHEAGKKITEISFSSLFPIDMTAEYCREKTSTMKPIEYRNKIYDFIDYDNPLRLVITGDMEFNELVNISKFIPEARAGENEDIYYDIEFRTHRDTPIETIDENNQNSLYSNRPTQSTYYNPGDSIKASRETDIRDGPSADSNSIGKIRKDEVLEIYSTENGYADVYWGMHGGFVLLSDFSKV